MPYASRADAVRALYTAFAKGEREVLEELFAPGYRFHAPPDPDLDRDGFFSVCWPNSGNIEAYEIVRLIEDGDEAVVTYEATRADGTRFRNTEILTFAGEQVVDTEVYFGWDLS